MTAWTYGTEGERYPVEPGHTWQLGEHVFHCSDIMATETFDALLQDYVPTLLYCDPPWGQSLVNSFRTKAGLDRATYRWEALYERLTSIAVTYGIPLWLEGSKPDSRDGAKVLGTMTAAGTERHAWNVTYFNTNPSGLYYTGTVPYPEALKSSLVGMDDEHTPLEVLQQTASGGVVIDPCAGRGLTSRSAEQAGWQSINNELNPYRVSAALSRLADLTGQQPERIA